jgi:hypothetical protein
MSDQVFEDDIFLAEPEPRASRRTAGRPGRERNLKPNTLKDDHA